MFVLGSFCYKSTFCDDDSTTQPFCVFVSLCVRRVNVHMYVPVRIEIKCHHCTQKNLRVCVCVFIHMCLIYGYDVCLCACSYMWSCVLFMGLMCLHVCSCVNTCVWSMGMMCVCVRVPVCIHICNLWVWCESTCMFLCVHMCVIYGCCMEVACSSRPSS